MGTLALAMDLFDNFIQLMPLRLLSPPLSPLFCTFVLFLFYIDFNQSFVNTTFHSSLFFFVSIHLPQNWAAPKMHFLDILQILGALFVNSGGSGRVPGPIFGLFWSIFGALFESSFVKKQKMKKYSKRCNLRCFVRVESSNSNNMKNWQTNDWTN